MHQSAFQTDSTRLDSLSVRDTFSRLFRNPLRGWSENLASGRPLPPSVIFRVCVHVHVGVVATTCLEPGFLDYRDEIQAMGTDPTR